MKISHLPASFLGETEEGLVVNTGSLLPLSQVLCLPPFEECLIQSLGQGTAVPWPGLAALDHGHQQGRGRTTPGRSPKPCLMDAKPGFCATQPVREGHECRFRPSRSPRSLLPHIPHPRYSPSCTPPTQDFSEILFPKLKKKKSQRYYEQSLLKEGLRAFRRCIAVSGFYGTFAFK